ncbi:transposase [Nonomuraea sp. NPDC002799]
MARGDLTDDEWALVEPYLPLGERGPIPDLRRQFNAVMWHFRVGGPWRGPACGVRLVVHGL